MILFCISLGILLILLGIIVLKNKDSVLLYDMIENLKKEKAIIDKEGLSKFSGIGSIIIGLEIISMCIALKWSNYLVYSSFRIAIAITLVYMLCASQRFDATNFNDKGKIKSETKIVMCILSIIIFGITFFNMI